MDIGLFLRLDGKRLSRSHPLFDAPVSENILDDPHNPKNRRRRGNREGYDRINNSANNMQCVSIHDSDIKYGKPIDPGNKGEHPAELSGQLRSCAFHSRIPPFLWILA